MKFYNKYNFETAIIILFTVKKIITEEEKEEYV